jgi:hypothetical protein
VGISRWENVNTLGYWVDEGLVMFFTFESVIPQPENKTTNGSIGTDKNDAFRRNHLILLGYENLFQLQ